VKSKNGIFKNSGNESLKFTIPTVSAEPNIRVEKDIRNPINDENVNFMISFFYSI
jgi:hypothetical protein